jgi:hypothetical protein
MPEPLPISKEELEKLLKDPKALVRRMVLSFVLERPRQLGGRPGPRRPRG